MHTNNTQRMIDSIHSFHRKSPSFWNRWRPYLIRGAPVRWSQVVKSPLCLPLGKLKALSGIHAWIFHPLCPCPSRWRWWVNMQLSMLIDHVLFSEEDSLTPGCFTDRRETSQRPQVASPQSLGPRRQSWVSHGPGPQSQGSPGLALTPDQVQLLLLVSEHQNFKLLNWGKRARQTAASRPSKSRNKQ